MEYALWQIKVDEPSYIMGVLILVLMEYALWHLQHYARWNEIISLNPCSNGICSLTIGDFVNEKTIKS